MPLIWLGCIIHAREPYCPSVCSSLLSPLSSLTYFRVTPGGTARSKKSCSIRQTCIPNPSIPVTCGEVKIFAKRQKDIHEPGALHDIFSSTLAFPVGMIQQTELRWMCQYAAGISLHPDIRTATHHTIQSPLMFTRLET